MCVHCLAVALFTGAVFFPEKFLPVPTVAKSDHAKRRIDLANKLAADEDKRGCKKRRRLR